MRPPEHSAKRSFRDGKSKKSFFYHFQNSDGAHRRVHGFGHGFYHRIRHHGRQGRPLHFRLQGIHRHVRFDERHLSGGRHHLFEDRRTRRRQLTAGHHHHLLFRRLRPNGYAHDTRADHIQRRARVHHIRHNYGQRRPNARICLVRNGNLFLPFAQVGVFFQFFKNPRGLCMRHIAAVFDRHRHYCGALRAACARL